MPLQWGRGSSAAEITRALSTMHDQSVLQWGRGSSAAEMTNMWSSTSGVYCPLQWGRGSSAAEMRFSKPASVTWVQGFNGAAALQPRKSFHLQPERELDERLQWGRGSSAAEIEWPQYFLSVEGEASMGPRLFSRGNGVPADQTVSLFVASMGPRLFSRGNHSQRGRIVNGEYHASMGPRLFSRGNVLQDRDHLLPRLAASMGPRLFSRGNQPLDLGDDPVGNASMGPRLFSRGNGI